MQQRLSGSQQLRLSVYARAMISRFVAPFPPSPRRDIYAVKGEDRVVFAAVQAANRIERVRIACGRFSATKKRATATGGRDSR